MILTDLHLIGVDYYIFSLLFILYSWLLDEDFIYVAIRSLTWFIITITSLYKLAMWEWDLSLWFTALALWLSVMAFANFFIKDENKKLLEKLDKRLDAIEKMMDSMLKNISEKEIKNPEK